MTSSVEIGELTDVLSGFAFKSTHFGDTGTPVIRIRDVVRGYSETFYDGEFDEKFVIKDGEILIGMDGEFNCSRWGGGKALLNQRVCRIESTSGELDDQYLYRFLPRALKEIERDTPFVTVKHLSAKKIKGIKIPLPPIEEQRRIAAVLDAADALRDKRRQAIAKLDTLTQAIFIDMFGDPAGGRTELVALNDLVRAGITRGIDQPGPDVPDGMPYIKTTDFRNDLLRRGDLAKASLEIASKTTKSIVDVGDIVVCIRATVGPVMLIGEELAGVNLSRGTARVSPGEQVLPRFLLEAMKTDHFKHQIDRKLRGATFLQLPLGELKQLVVQRPAIEKQRSFVERVETLVGSLNKSADHARQLDQLFASLQQRAFRGEL